MNIKHSRPILFGFGLLLLIAVAYISWNPVRILNLANEFSTAKTADEELSVARKINAQEHSYTVQAFDSSGTEIMRTRQATMQAWIPS